MKLKVCFLHLKGLQAQYRGESDSAVSVWMTNVCETTENNSVHADYTFTRISVDLVKDINTSYRRNKAFQRLIKLIASQIDFLFCSVRNRTR